MTPTQHKAIDALSRSLFTYNEIAHALGITYYQVRDHFEGKQ